MIHTMLSLDLKDAKPQRYSFDKKMKEEGFHKLANVDTVWAHSVEGYAGKEGLIARAFKQFLKDLVTELEIPAISYVVQIGNTVPLGVRIEKVNGIYRVQDFEPIETEA